MGKADPHAEVTQQIQEVNRTMWKLNDYWKASEASKKWKILIFDAVLKSKLLYGLETTQLPRSCKKRIDTFQLRGLRKILGMKHTYYDRTATNKKIFEEATKEAYQKGNKKQRDKNARKTVEAFSATYQKRRKKLLGHIIRTANEDPLRQISLQKGKAKALHWEKRRVGKPRAIWAEEVLNKVWKENRHEAPK